MTVPVPRLRYFEPGPIPTFFSDSFVVFVADGRSFSQYSIGSDTDSVTRVVNPCIFGTDPGLGYTVESYTDPATFQT